MEVVLVCELSIALDFRSVNAHVQTPDSHSSDLALLIAKRCMQETYRMYGSDRHWYVMVSDVKLE